MDFLKRTTGSRGRWGRRPRIRGTRFRADFWPYYAPSPLRGGASKGARGGRFWIRVEIVHVPHSRDALTRAKVAKAEKEAELGSEKVEMCEGRPLGSGRVGM